MTKINRIEEIKFDKGTHTVEAYLALPLEQKERRVWFWPFKWYIEPCALECGEDGIFEFLSEWDKFETYTKKRYPVQSFIRNEIHIEKHGSVEVLRKNYISIEGRKQKQ